MICSLFSDHRNRLLCIWGRGEGLAFVVVGGGGGVGVAGRVEARTQNPPTYSPKAGAGRAAAE